MLIFNYLLKYFSNSLKENIDRIFSIRSKEENISEETPYDYFILFYVLYDSAFMIAN